MLYHIPSFSLLLCHLRLLDITYINNENFYNRVIISPKKVILRREKSIALYSSAHTLCGVYG